MSKPEPIFEGHPKRHAELLKMAKRKGMTVPMLAEHFTTTPPTIRKWLRLPLSYVSRTGRPPKPLNEITGGQPSGDCFPEADRAGVPGEAAN